MPRRLLVIQVAGLGYALLTRHAGGDEWCGLRFRPAQSVFPALTCPVQASFRTASPPSSHGMVFNGVYQRPLRKPSFWEQSSALVDGPRIWDDLRQGGKTVGLVFWQQSLGEDVDVLLSPAPIHKHHGGMIDDLYARPTGLYQQLMDEGEKRFKLRSYWGPLASSASSRWIASATAGIMAILDGGPDLLLVYLPHLDYALLRHGPSGDGISEACEKVLDLLWFLRGAAEGVGAELLVFGDYAFADVTRPLYPNRALLERGLMQAREVRGMLYPDLHTSRAFAVVDHEIAHVYVREPSDVGTVAEAVAAMDGVEAALTGDALVERGIAHPNCGEIVLVAEEGAWFAYPWWTEKRQQPDYATHVDIHNKPGFDPCELFWGWPPFLATSTDATKVGGSHGRVGEGREVAWAATCDLGEPNDLIELAEAVRGYMKDA